MQRNFTPHYSKQMTYRFAIWRLCFSRTLCLARAAAKASSWNGFGCARVVRPLQVLVRVWTTRAVAWPGVRWHVKLRQEGPYPWASGAIAYNVSICVRAGLPKPRPVPDTERNKDTKTLDYASTPLDANTLLAVVPLCCHFFLSRQLSCRFTSRTFL